MRCRPDSLTVLQARVLSLVRSRIASHGAAPTSRELGLAMGTAHHMAWLHVNALIRKGCLVRAGRAPGAARAGARTLRLIASTDGPARVDLASGTPAHEASGGRGVAYRVTAADGGAV